MDKSISQDQDYVRLQAKEDNSLFFLQTLAYLKRAAF